MADLREHFGISHMTLYRHLKKHFGDKFKGKKWLYPGEVQEIMDVFNNVQPNATEEDDRPLL
jgi:hypothetical protein